MVIFIVIIGTLEELLIGTRIYFLSRGRLAQYGTLYMILQGLAAVLMMLSAARCLGLIRERLGWQVFPCSGDCRSRPDVACVKAVE